MHWFAPLVAAMVALACSGVALAQSTPAERARDLISGFGIRSSLPPVHSTAKLEAADSDVCRELGMQLAKLSKDEATRLCSHIGRSSNPLAHASLLIAMANGDDSIRSLCLDTLVTLRFSEVLALGEAVRKVHGSVFESLREDGTWTRTIESKVTELCSQDERHRYSKVVQHQQACLALIVDLYGGDKGFETMVNELLRNMVGEGPASDIKDEEPPVDPDNPPKPGDDVPPPPVDDGLSDQERERIRLIKERRRGAIDMFKRLLVIDPDGFFQLGMSAPYERRVERAAQFWERLGGVAAPVTTPEEARVESQRLIRNDYVEKYGEVRSWRGMLLWLQREAPIRDEKVMALILMDELCEGVKVPADKVEPKPGEPPPEEEPDAMVPAITGGTMRIKVEEFLALDLRNGQRPRTRAIRKVFEDRFMNLD
jgi:hypothetical protein